MHGQLLAQSPLLVLPLVALGLFAAVFLANAVRAFTAKGLDRAAALPLVREETLSRKGGRHGP